MKKEKEQLFEELTHEQQLAQMQKEFDENFLTSTNAFNAKLQTKIKTSLNARYYPKNYEVRTQPSKTLPDQSMPLKTILERFAKGLPLSAGIQEPIWDEDPQNEGIDLRKLDLAEKEALLDQTKEFINTTRKKLATVPPAGLPLNPISEKNSPAAQAPPEEKN